MAPQPKPKHIRALANARPAGYDRGNTPPDIEPGIPECPEYLEGDALEMWKYLAPRLDKARVLNANMKYSLIALCETWAVYRAALKAEQWGKWDKALGRLMRFSKMFGLDPSGLSGLHAPAPDRTKGQGKKRHIK